MTSARGLLRRAGAAHRRAAGWLESARSEIDRASDEPLFSSEALLQQAEIVHALQQAAAALDNGWWTVAWESTRGGHGPLGTDPDTPPWGRGGGAARLIRVGTAHPVSEGAPVLVPFLGGGHLSLDVDSRDPRAVGFVRGVLLRVLAAMPPGSVRVLAVDGGALGITFTPLRPLVGVDLITEPATDLVGFRAVLTAAEDHVKRALAEPEGAQTWVILAVAALPPGAAPADLARLSALAHAGVANRLCLVVAGYPTPEPRDPNPAPELEHTTWIRAAGEDVRVGNPPGEPYGVGGRGVNAPVVLDSGPPEHILESVCEELAALARAGSTVRFADLMPGGYWRESAAAGLRTVVGRIGREPAWLALDDGTPHWLVAGRTGSGKTVFLLDALYGLAARYSPDELALYLLDFKEGVSFAEFTPTESDPTWIPHARTVGVESDREYGVAVLAALVAEMSARSTRMKQVGVNNLAALRAARPDRPMPRIVTVIDEFHVLFTGNDAIAKRASALLEEVARRGRSYGVHLILASQTTAGIEALFAKGQAIFGQFGQRVALAGGGGVLGGLSDTAEALPVGSVILNAAAGAPEANQRARFPDTDAEAVHRVRTLLWQRRAPGAPAPEVFAGYAEQHLADDPSIASYRPGARRRVIPVGRAVEVGLPTATFPLDGSPGRHLAVLGTSGVGADVLHAAAVGLARQHADGTARFVLAGLVAAADDVVDEVAREVVEAGQRCAVVDVAGLRTVLGELARPDPPTGPAAGPETGTYLVVWGMDAAGPALKAAKDPESGKTGLDDLRTVLQTGPAQGAHMVAWWRGFRRFVDDLGASGREDVAGLVALNVPGKDLGSLLGEYSLAWSARPNRALLVDRHEDSTRLVVPFVRPGRIGEQR